MIVMVIWNLGRSIEDFLFLSLLTFLGFIFPINLIGELGHTMFLKVLNLCLVFTIRFELCIACIMWEYFS